MSMSHDMVKAYVRSQLAKAVSAGIIKGTTELANGHTHRFAVMYDEHNKMFVGETSWDGGGPHTHYIMRSVQDVVETHLDNDPQPRTEEEIVEFVDIANAPSNMRRILDFYNLKAIRMETHPSHPNDHVHVLVVRFAGHNMDRMGRKVEASIFNKLENEDRELENVKNAKANAENELNRILNLNQKSFAKNKDDSESTEEQEEAEEAVVKATEQDGKVIADELIAEIRKKAQSADDELMARVKESVEARKKSKKYS